MSTHPAEREAERLRTIIETMILTQPHVTMQDAGPMIFEIEKKTASMEAVQVAPSPGITTPRYPVPDFEPATLKSFIDLVPSIQAHITGSRKINAIKELRTLTGAGLKDAKHGVERWEAETKARPKSHTTSVSYGTSPVDIAEWMHDFCPVAKDFLLAAKKIQAIKEVRALHPDGIGLKEAKDGVEYYEKHYL